ncbi:unnamed protein product [Colias eurytheme]|nr:unnamed protein product [Colias eurytheme]
MYSPATVLPTTRIVPNDHNTHGTGIKHECHLSSAGRALRISATTTRTTLYTGGNNIFLVRIPNAFHRFFLIRGPTFALRDRGKRLWDPRSTQKQIDESDPN